MCNLHGYSRWFAAALFVAFVTGLVPTGPIALAAAEMRDPLQPPNLRRSEQAPQVDPSDWKLTSTLVSDDRLVAIINGRVVAPGGTVDGARVIAVERGQARLRVGETTFTIRSSTPTIRSSGGSEAQP